MELLTLVAAWDAIAYDLVRQPEYLPKIHSSVMQAYKNGVAAVLARGVTQEATALTKYFDARREPPIDEAQALAEVIWPAWILSAREHPDWSELHRDALIAGGQTVLAMMFCGQPIKEITAELHRFTPREAMN
jgi:hypothetical protein